MRTLIAPAHRARMLRILAAGVLLAGYIELAAGSRSAAPLLLTLGYLVLVPALLLQW